MPCNQGDAARTNLIPISVTQEWTDDGGTDDRILFVSNAPEGYGAETEKPILYRAKLTVPASGILKFRAWIWHMRIVETAPDQLFLACKLVGSNGTLGSHRVISGTGGTAPYSNLELLGRCLAKAQLFGTLDGALKLSLPNGVTKVIGSYTVPYSLHPDTQPKVVGAIHEFEIKGQEGNEFYLWTGVAAGNTPPPYGTTDDVALSGDHVRGIWASCAHAVKTTTAIDVGPLPIPAERGNLYLSDKDGVDQNPYDAANVISMEASAKDNKGCYGVDLTYTLELTNSNEVSQGKGFVSIRARNTEGWFAGAYEAIVDPQTIKKGLPLIRFGQPESGVEIGASQVQAGQTEFFVFRLAVAGAASTPPSVQVNALGVAPPPEDP